MMVLTQLRKFEERLKKKVEAGERAAQFGPGVPMDDAALEAMADAQGDACDDGYLPALAAELRAMVAVLVEQAFATQFRGGVAVYDEHLTERAGALLLRVQYLRSPDRGHRRHLVRRRQLLPRAPVLFGLRAGRDAHAELVQVDAQLGAVATALPRGPLHEGGRGRRLARGGGTERVRQARVRVARARGHLGGRLSVATRSCALIKEPKGFTDETIHVPRYDNNNDGDNAFYTSLSASMSAGADPKFFDPLPKSVGDQVAALVKKHNA